MADELLARQMPHNLEAEQAVLGAMLIDADCINDVMDKLQPEDFYIKQNREIFETIYTMFSFGKPVDGITVADEMQKNGVYDELTTRKYLAQLIEITPTSANVMEYVAIIRDKSLLRSLARAAGDILTQVQEGGGEAAATLEAAEQKVFAIRWGRSAQEMVPIAQVIKPVLDDINALSASKVGLRGISTGFSGLDAKIHGLGSSDLIILAARPGMGKSSFAMNIATNVARNSGKTVAVFNLEMSKEQLVTRLLSSEALVNNKNLTTGRLSNSDWGKLTQAARSLKQMDMRLDDNPMLTVAEMNAKCRRLDNLGLVIIDYLQLISSSGGKSYSGESRQQAVSDISRMLKIMAKELNVPVLCLSQLSRSSEKREEKRPVMSDLRDSGSIEQDADVVMFLYRDGYYNKDSEEGNMAECIIAKNRHGETCTVPLCFLAEYTTFTTPETRYDED